MKLTKEMIEEVVREVENQGGSGVSVEKIEKMLGQDRVALANKETEAFADWWDHNPDGWNQNRLIATNVMFLVNQLADVAMEHEGDSVVQTMVTRSRMKAALGGIISFLDAIMDAPPGVLDCEALSILTKQMHRKIVSDLVKENVQ